MQEKNNFTNIMILMYRKYIIIVLGNLYAQAFDMQAFGIQANIIRQSDNQAFLVQVNGSVTSLPNTKTKYYLF